MADDTQENYVTQFNFASSYAQVLEAHRVLNQEVEALNAKVEQTMDRHEAEFLLAYQNHIRKIKYELEEIKKKTDEQEHEMKKNERAFYLEKQITLFREEALKLYDRLEEKTQEAEIYKLKSKDLEKTCYISQKEVRELTKAKKLLEAKLRAHSTRITELEQELKEKDESICRLTALGTQSNTKVVTLDNINFKLASNPASKACTVSKNTPTGFRKKTVSYLGQYQESELKEWFIECVKSIKRDVAYRKNSGYQFELSTIKDIEEFQMVDKLKLLEKFMENEKLLTWMYEKIFPSRIEEVKSYLSQRAMSLDPTKKQLLADPPDCDEEALRSSKLGLPKMTELSRSRKSTVRNRLSMKEGKLNLSSY